MNATGSPALRATALALEIGLTPIPMFFLPFVAIMTLGRFVTQKSCKTQMSINILMLLTCTYCLYQIVGNVFVGLGGYYEYDNMPIYIVRNCVPFLYIVLFTAISMCYIYTLVKTSISFEIIVSGAVTTREVRKRRKVLFRLLRGASLILLVTGSIAVSLVSVAMCVLYGIRRYNLIPQNIYQPLNNILVPVTGIPVLIVYAVLLIMFTIMLIFTLKRSNSVLKHQKDKAHHDRIMDRKMKIVRYVLGLILYVSHCILVGVATIVYVVKQLIPSTPFEFVIIDLFIRVFPIPLLLSSILVVFWPFQLPKSIVTVIVGNDIETKREGFMKMLRTVGIALNTRVDMETEDDMLTTESTISQTTLDSSYAQRHLDMTKTAAFIPQVSDNTISSTNTSTTSTISHVTVGNISASSSPQIDPETTETKVETLNLEMQEVVMDAKEPHIMQVSISEETVQISVTDIYWRFTLN